MALAVNYPGAKTLTHRTTNLGCARGGRNCLVGFFREVRIGFFRGHLT